MLGVGGVITLNEPYETLVPSSLYHVSAIHFFIFRLSCLCILCANWLLRQKLTCCKLWNLWCAIKNMYKNLFHDVYICSGLELLLMSRFVYLFIFRLTGLIIWLFPQGIISLPPHLWISTGRCSSFIVGFFHFKFNFGKVGGWKAGFLLVLLLYFGTDNATCGKTTYVHCKAGRGRSTTIVLCYLVSSRSLWSKVVASVETSRCWLVAFWSAYAFQVEYKHMTPAAALEYVRSRRPRVLLAPSQWKV